MTKPVTRKATPKRTRKGQTKPAPKPPKLAKKSPRPRAKKVAPKRGTRPTVNENGLTVSQQQFADLYLADEYRNATRTYMALHPSAQKNTAACAGSRLLNHPPIRAYIESREAELAEKFRLTPEIVLAGYAEIIHRDVREFFHADGRLKLPSDWTKQQSGALDSVKTREVHIGGNKEEPPDIITTHELKFIGRKGALDSVARHLGMFEKDNRQGGLMDALELVLAATARQGIGPPSARV